ncbi:hypothetical protein FGB62_12g332 [Gracilaria domingensis]|nr:hypothetical protein FGB62_12g332 [Gracilaria domingensis]
MVHTRILERSSICTRRRLCRIKQRLLDERRLRRLTALGRRLLRGGTLRRWHGRLWWSPLTRQRRISSGGAGASGATTPLCEKLGWVPYKSGIIEQTLALRRQLSFTLALALSVYPPAKFTLVERDTGMAVNGTEVQQFAELVHPVSLCGIPDEADCVELSYAVQWELVLPAVGAHLGDPHAEVRVGDGHATVAIGVVVAEQERVAVLPRGLIGVPHEGEAIQLRLAVPLELALLVQLALAHDPPAELALGLGHVAVAVPAVPLRELGVAALPQHGTIGVGVHGGLGGGRRTGAARAAGARRRRARRLKSAARAQIKGAARVHVRARIRIKRARPARRWRAHVSRCPLAWAQQTARAPRPRHWLFQTAAAPLSVSKGGPLPPGLSGRRGTARHAAYLADEADEADVATWRARWRLRAARLARRLQHSSLRGVRLCARSSAFARLRVCAFARFRRRRARRSAEPRSARARCDRAAAGAHDDAAVAQAVLRRRAVLNVRRRRAGRGARAVRRRRALARRAPRLRRHRLRALLPLALRRRARHPRLPRALCAPRRLPLRPLQARPLRRAQPRRRARAAPVPHAGRRVRQDCAACRQHVARRAARVPRAAEAAGGSRRAAPVLADPAHAQPAAAARHRAHLQPVRRRARRGRLACAGAPRHAARVGGRRGRQGAVPGLGVAAQQRLGHH